MVSSLPSFRRTASLILVFMEISTYLRFSLAFQSSLSPVRPLPGRLLPSVPLYAAGLSDIIKGDNEWGIPYSKDLPPLYDYEGAEVLPNGGKVTLLGSGPGDPDLLTMKAYKLLTQADENTVVISDRLVSQEILDIIATPNVKIARKLPGCAELAQEEIYWWAYQALNQGKHVIRLKIGDPFVFGRGGEEVLTFRKFGLDSKVIPVSVAEKRRCLVLVRFWFAVVALIFGFDLGCCRVFEFHLPEIGCTCSILTKSLDFLTCLVFPTLACFVLFGTLHIGCLSCLFGTLVGIDSCDPPRDCQSSCHVHRVRPRRNFPRSHSVPRGANYCLSYGRWSPADTLSEAARPSWLSV